MDSWIIAETAPRVDQNWTQAQLAQWIPLAAQVARDLDYEVWCYFDSTVGGDFRIKSPEACAAMGAEIAK